MSPFSTIAALVGLTSLIGVAEAGFNYSSMKQVIAFGDSYSFVQGTGGRTNKTFLGDYVNYAYTATQLMNNKIVQNFTGTAEGGPNWLEYLTGCAVNTGSYSPADCSIALWDFAYAGASVSDQYTPRHTKWTIPLVNQTSRFLKYGEPVLRSKGKLDKTKALVTIWIGVNDIFDTQTYKPSAMSYADFWALEINAIFQQSVMPLYQNGFTNFLFLNLPPLDRTSANQRTSTPYPSQAQVNLWGTILANATTTFQQQNPNANAMLYDANTFLNGLLSKPATYGITRTASYCPAWDQVGVLTNATAYGCSPLNKYFWYNAVHMSSRTHQLMAADLTNFLKSQ